MLFMLVVCHVDKNLTDAHPCRPSLLTLLAPYLLVPLLLLSWYSIYCGLLLGASCLERVAGERNKCWQLPRRMNGRGAETRGHSLPDPSSEAIHCLRYLQDPL